MRTIIRPGDKVELRAAHRAAQVIRLLEATKASIRLDQLRESIGPDFFDHLLTEYMSARLAKSYKLWPDQWKDLVVIRDAPDMLRTYVEKVAPLANLDRVEDSGGEFQKLPTPLDIEISYSCAGWGNLLVADFETLRSDRLGWFKRVADEAGKAAARTFNRWLFQTMLQANPIYAGDGHRLFDHEHHGNDPHEGSVTELTFDALKTAWNTMRSQRDDNGEPLVVTPGFLVVGPPNEVAAYKLIESEYVPGEENASNFFRGRFRIIVTPYLGVDWYLWAKPEEIEGLEVGFLDGKVAPSIYMLNPDVSDTYFRTKKTMWRVEHYYGGAWIDYRGIVRGGGTGA